MKLATGSERTGVLNSVWRVGMASAMLLALGLVSACNRPDEPPIVRACLTLEGGNFGGNELGEDALGNDELDGDSLLLRRCRCVDGIIHRQLDGQAYEAISKIAENYVNRPVIESSAISATVVEEFGRKSGIVEGAIAGADLTLAIAKATTRCP